MNKIKPYILIFILLIIVMVFSKNIIQLTGSITTIFRKDNLNSLIENATKIKIETLEKELANYEKAYNDYKIYDANVYVLAKTAIRNVYDFYDYIIISPTSRVNTTSPVINEAGLVGIVTKSSTKTAKVTLLTSVKNLSVKVSNSYGLLNGYDKKNKLLIIRNINNYDEINIGDKVYTSGLEGIQDNLLVGEVIRTKLEGVERIVYVKSSVNFDAINYVCVINK